VIPLGRLIGPPAQLFKKFFEVIVVMVEQLKHQLYHWQWCD
jgi:hypothetical protein